LAMAHVDLSSWNPISLRTQPLNSTAKIWLTVSTSMKASQMNFVWEDLPANPGAEAAPPWHSPLKPPWSLHH
jgi:hypothetical protein